MSLPIVERPADDDYCRVSARDEPLVGTAAESVQRWLLLEDGAPWGPKPPKDSQLPTPAQRWLLAQDQRPGTRTVLIRRPGRGRGPRRRLFLAEAGEAPGQRRLLKLEVDLDELPALDEAALLSRAEPCEDPLWLVCTHGTRDRCCAKWGQPLWAAMQALVQGSGSDGDEERVWQSAHLGGHRFAPIVLALPVGLQWGRIEIDDIPTLLQGVAAGQIPALDRLRGRCCHSRAAQAGECLLRLEHDLVADDALQLLEQRSLADGEQLRFRDRDGAVRTITVALVERPDLASSASCGEAPMTRAVFTRR